MALLTVCIVKNLGTTQQAPLMRVSKLSGAHGIVFEGFRLKQRERRNRDLSFDTKYDRKTCKIFVCQRAFLATVRGNMELVLILDGIQ